MCHFVRGLACKRNRVHRELRRLFNEGFSSSVLPVGETGHIRTHCSYWFGFLHDSSVNLLCRLSFPASVCILVSSVQLHRVWVNDFGFFFEVESLFMVLVRRLTVLVCEVLLIGREKLRIRITNKTVGAPRFACSFIPHRKTRI